MHCNEEKLNTTMANDTMDVDEDSAEDTEKYHTSGDDGTAEEIEEKHEKNDVVEHEDEDDDDEDDDDEEDGEKDEPEEETESEYSESEESDSLDEGETEDRRQKYVTDMSDLEKQFAHLKEQLYQERLTQIEDQLGKVNQLEAEEYLGQLKLLEQNCKIRAEFAEFLKHYRTINLENKIQCEVQSAEQHFQNEENTFVNSLIIEFEEKLRKVEEERHTAEMYSELWCEDSFHNKKKRKGMEIFVPDKRKKTVTVTGPYIIYMLNEMDILEDWATIRKAKIELARRNASEVPSDKDGSDVTARYEDGKFFYQGEWFQKGEQVILDNRIDFPVHASITGINTGEVWVSKRDGVKCKLYIAQFQKGKYIMHRAPDENVITI